MATSSHNIKKPDDHIVGVVLAIDFHWAAVKYYFLLSGLEGSDFSSEGWRRSLWKPSETDCRLLKGQKDKKIIHHKPLLILAMVGFFQHVILMLKALAAKQIR